MGWLGNFPFPEYFSVTLHNGRGSSSLILSLLLAFTDVFTVIYVYNLSRLTASSTLWLFVKL